LIIKGPKEYTDLIDVEAIPAYLRDHGASKEAIEQLKIEFVQELFGSLFDRIRGVEMHGRCMKGVIQISMRVIEEEKYRKEALRCLNDTLLHELTHFCEPASTHRKTTIFVAMAGIWLAASTYLMPMIINAIPIDGALQTLLIVAVWIALIVTYVRMLYWLSPSERAARKAGRSGVWLLQRDAIPRIKRLIQQEELHAIQPSQA